MTGTAASQRLPAADRRVDIGGVELDTATAPAGAFGRYHRRAAAEKAVEHDVAAGRAVEDRIGDQRHRLHCWMQRREIALLGAAAKGIASRVPPHIAAVAPEAAKLDVVAVLVAAVFEDKDELVLAAVKRAHPGIILDPNAEVLDLAVDAVGGAEQLCDMAPIHADVMQR